MLGAAPAAQHYHRHRLMWYEVQQIICPPAGCEGHRMLFRTAPPGRRFQLALIKPSHYDDDGYVIQWMRSIIPSNTLAVLYSLFQDSAARQALGSDVAIDISVQPVPGFRRAPSTRVRC